MMSEMFNAEGWCAWIGNWSGVCRTWFEPGKLADESEVRGRWEWATEGKILRHVYTGAIQGKARQGEEYLAYNPITGIVQHSWWDDFHMNQLMLISTGNWLTNGCSVRGVYDVGVDLPQWGWRTDFISTSTDELSLTSYNVTPEGEEAKAVEVIYQRVV